MTSVRNDDGSVGSPLAEQQLHLNDHQNESLIANQSNLERLAKKKPMMPTRLYVLLSLF